MAPEVRRSNDQEQWLLGGRRVTQVIVDPASVRLQAWTLDGAVDVRLGAPFELELSTGRLQLDPEAPAQLGPILALISMPLHSLTAYRTGALLVQFAGVITLRVEPHPAFEAWEVCGSGEFSELSYLAAPGGGSPWG